MNKITELQSISSGTAVSCLSNVLNNLIYNNNLIARNFDMLETGETSTVEQVLYKLRKILMVPEGKEICEQATLIMAAMGKQYNFYPSDRGESLTVSFPKDHPIHGQIGHREYYGVGLASMNDQFQKEATTLHNTKMDGVQGKSFDMMCMDEIEGSGYYK